MATAAPLLRIQLQEGIGMAIVMGASDGGNFPYAPERTHSTHKESILQEEIGHCPWTQGQCPRGVQCRDTMARGGQPFAPTTTAGSLHRVKVFTTSNYWNGECVAGNSTGKSLEMVAARRAAENGPYQGTVAGSEPSWMNR